MLGTLVLPLIPAALAVSTVATAVSWLLLPMRPTYDVPFYSVSASLVVWAIVFGPLAGLAAVGYVRLICWADALKPKRPFRLFVAPLIVFLALGALALPFPQLLGNGKDVVQLAFSGGLALALILPVAALKPLATAACLGSGAPGGLFTPTLAFGALVGAFAGHVWWLVSGRSPCSAPSRLSGPPLFGGLDAGASVGDRAGP